MRIHGVHLNGLDSPSGAHQFACEPGYTVVACPDVRVARRLMAVVRALLCDPGALRGSGRAGVSLSFGRDAYRLVADLARGRVVLARYDTRNKPQRVATGPAEILRVLREAGLPDARDLERLCLWPPPDSEDGAHESYLALERRVKDLESEFEEFAPIADQLDGLEQRVAAYRTAQAERVRTHASIGAHREVLLEDRRKLRAALPARLAAAWAGGALGLAGSAAALRLGPGFWELAALGPCIAFAFALGVLSARRAQGRLESRLASLRASEREAEQRFHADSRQLGELLRALDLDSCDALLRVADEYPRAALVLEDTRAQLEAVRRALPEGDGMARSRAEDGPEPMLEAAARARGVDPETLRRCLAPVLPVYLRALSGGALAKARWEPERGWSIQRAKAPLPVALDALDADDRARVGLAFRLALLEALAPQLRVPLLVGPEPGPGTALPRSLRRLGAVGQVIHFCTAESDAAKHAHRVHRFC